MTFIEKLDWLMQQKGLNKHTLAAQSGIAYTTIVGLYERGMENARISTINKLCAFFNVSLDYLVLDCYEKPEDFVPNGNAALIVCEDAKEVDLIQMFRAMNDNSKNLILTFVRTMAGNPETQEGVTINQEIS